MKTKRTIKNLKNLRIIKNLRNLMSLASLISLISLMSLTTATAQISATEADFSAPGQVTVTYDLTSPGPVDVGLYYSLDKCDWKKAKSVTGDLLNQTTDTGKQIVWNNSADNVLFGKYYFKVETIPSEADIVEINGVKWASKNLDVGGWFVENDYDYGALYQWGRHADGHESRTSANYLTDNNTSESTPVSSAYLDANGQVIFISGAYGKFIKNSDYTNFFLDWRTPQENALWNSGTEVEPVKTAADPCPAGWRVPTETEASKLIETANVTATWTVDYNDSSIDGLLVTDNATSAFIFLPAGGSRNPFNGSCDSHNLAGYYWLNMSSTVMGNGLSLSDGWYNTGWGAPRGYGVSIRCVVDQ